jgi:pyridoxamine 5'-phosphate oxidase
MDLADDPVAQFRAWFDEAVECGVHEVEAVVVSTVGADGLPSSRHVLLKGLDGGFVFYTNYESRKGRELAAHPTAALCFPWKELNRQVRVVGPVEKVSPEQSDAYFATRPRDSQLGAWASHQSEVLTGRHVLEDRLAEMELRFAGAEVPRPPHWGGYRVVPWEVEFWQGRPSRLHDRFLYTHDGAAPTGWRLDRLSP